MKKINIKKITRSKFFFLIILFISLIIFSCEKRVIIKATKDVALFENYKDINFNGKNIVSDTLGYQTVKFNKKGIVTYPALYLGSGNPDSVKDAFVLGGFDISKIKKDFNKAQLKFYINYSSFSRKRVMIFIRPVKREWDEFRVTFNDFYIINDNILELTDLSESDESECKLILFDIEANREDEYYKIPYPDSYREISINITDIVRKWLDNPQTNHGLLIDPMIITDLRYLTTNPSNELSATGTIEIASSEWYSWDGRTGNTNFMDIKNYAKNRIKYVPGIEITY